MLTLDLPSLAQSSNDNNDINLLDNIYWRAELSLVSYGVLISIRVSETSILEALQDYLPPGWQPSQDPVVDELYSFIASSSNSSYRLYRGQEQIAESQEIEDVLEAFDSNVRLQVGTLVKDRLFVHAGVVGWRGQAIVIPGRSFSGKTTLVATLIQTGATYYSDEYAVLDANGFVHPYPRLLSVRQEGGLRVKRCPVEEFGGKSGVEPLPVGMVIHTRYQSGVQWNFHQISLGQGVLTLLDNTIVARLRPEFALPILTKAVSKAVALEGERGEADEAAKEIFKQLEVLMN